MAIFSVKTYFLDVYRPIYKRTGVKKLSFGLSYLYIAVLLCINFYSVCAILGGLGASKYFIKLLHFPYIFYSCVAVFALTFWMLTPVSETLRDRKKSKGAEPTKVILFAVFTLIVFVAVKKIILTPVKDNRFDNVKMKHKP